MEQVIAERRGAAEEMPGKPTSADPSVTRKGTPAGPGPKASTAAREAEPKAPTATREPEPKALAAAREDMLEMAGMLEVAGGLVYDEPARETLDAYAEGLFSQVPGSVADSEVAEGFRQMDGWLQEYAAAPDEASRDDACGQLQREWLRLFVGVGEAEAPSWANYYLDPDQQVLGSESLKVREAYRTFGMEIAGLNKEPDDNLGLMLRFLGHLQAAEAEALADDGANADDDASDAADGEGDVTDAAADSGNAAGNDTAADGPADATAEARRLHDAQAAFLQQHVLPWIYRWRYEALKHARTAYYQGAAHFVFGLLKCYAERLGFAFDQASGAFAKRKDIER
jgi:TorA maturation chaperone TorD